ncbi:uncharacterized protein LOC130534251 [Takifugu flavidus]|uniref:uncharacterized protein LOC130534251 n=1 Tax=Takifugu flavidus TaxID=433684 RepID=UPI0025440812|nr:uncharacterized protein LOC130534251 [Takifugu flavidus]
MSTFGKVLKYDSTKKICKKLSGDGKGTAEWCTNVCNERGQILMSVLTCDESLEKMRPMAEGLMERYQRAGEAAPELMYVDRGCCCALGVSSLEQLFDKWVDRGMLIRLDIFHWIRRFDAAVRTDHHSKHALFKSALSAAVFSYNKDDVALLLQAVRAGLPDMADSLSDSELIERHVTNRDLSRYVRRITVGAQETFVRVQNVIDTLKGPAGMDDNQVHLFNEDIDRIWQNQQKHLECIQDPPGRNMYTIKKHVTRNGVSLPRYATDRGSNSLEGFHSFLPSVIPGPHCAAVPFQVYLLAGIARWNADRESASVGGQQGRQRLVYVHRLNERCQQLFGVVEDANYRAPVPPGGERIGLEYLFCQSTDAFNVPDHYAQTTNTLQADEDEGDEGPADEASHDVDDPPDDDAGYISEAVGDGLTPLPKNLHLTDLAVSPMTLTPAQRTCAVQIISRGTSRWRSSAESWWTLRWKRESSPSATLQGGGSSLHGTGSISTTDAFTCLTACTLHAGATPSSAAPTETPLNRLWCKSWSSANDIWLPTCWTPGRTG